MAPSRRTEAWPPSPSPDGPTYASQIPTGPAQPLSKFSFSFCPNLTAPPHSLQVSVFSTRAQSCPTLGDPTDCSPPGSSVRGISQARVLEWGAISFSGDLPDPGMEPESTALAGGFFTTAPPGEPNKCSTSQTPSLRIYILETPTCDAKEAESQKVS